MKLAPLAFLALVSSLTLPAHAAQIFAAIDCVPAKPLEAPLKVEWDTLLEIVSVHTQQTVDGDKHDEFTDIKSRMYESLNGKTLEVVDRYKKVEYKNALLPKGGLHSLRYDAVVFTVTKQDIPFSAGPPYPGVFPAWATLTLVSNYLEKTGDETRKVDIRKIEMNCKYTIKYGPF